MQLQDDISTNSRGLSLIMTPDQAGTWQAEKDAELVPQPELPVVPALAGHIDRAWAANKSAKQPIEEILLQCARQRDGKYDPEVLEMLKKQGETDPVYTMITDIKCRAAVAWIKDAMLPSGEVPFKVDPSPIPDLPPEMEGIAKAKIVGGLQQRLMETGLAPEQITREMMIEVAEQVKSDLKKEIKEMADADADTMSKEINDELVEGGWYEAMEDIIDDFVTYPTCFLEGPVLRRKRKQSWVQGEDGRSVFQVEMKVVREYQRVSPFDIYPSSGAKSLNDGNLIKRTRYSPAELQEFIGVEGFDEDAIREVLRLYAQGGLKEWLSVDSSRDVIEDRYSIESDIEPQIDALKFMGDVQGKMLLDWGMKADQIADPDLMYPVSCVKIGPHVISARINENPLKHRGFYCASFTKKSGSIWGRGIPQIVRDIQRICNGAARSLVRNMSMASGPLIWVNESRIGPTENVADLHPWKIFRFTDAEMKGRTDLPMGFFMPQSVANDLLAIYRHFYDQASEITGIPAYLYGSQNVSGAADTARGLSMLMDSAAKGLKSSVINIDKGIIIPSIREHWVNIMVYEPDRAVGDVNITPRASEYLMQLQQVQAAMFEALQATNNPTDMAIIGLEGRGEMLREYLQRAIKMPVDKIVPDRESLIQQSTNQQFMALVRGLSKSLGVDPQQLMQMAQGQQGALPQPQGAM